MIRNIDLRGGAAQIAELLEHPDGDPRPMMLEGGVGTSKTYPLQWLVHEDCMRHPGSRWVLARRTRSSMAETVLEEPWESDIIAEELRRRRVRVVGGEARRSYRYSNGSVVYPRGLDDVAKIMSGQFRGLLLHEVTPGPDSATGVSEKSFQYLLTRVWRRSQGFLLMECNPSAPDHWANRWANEGKIRRFYSRHWCNPIYARVVEDLPDGRTVYDWTDQWRAYYANISQLTGAPRKRLLDHEWYAAGGLVLPGWDPTLHLMPRSRFLSIPRHKFKLAWLAQDWGFDAPGCLQLWMSDVDGHIYRVWEIMYRERMNTWWAERVSELVQWCLDHYGLRPQTIECDHDPEAIAVYNKALARHGFSAVARETPKGPGSVEAGLDVLRQWLRPAGDEAFSTTCHFVEDAAWCGIDQSVKTRGWGTSFETLVGSYVLAETADGRPIKDMPDPGCRDDPIDAARYAVSWAAKHVRAERAPKTSELSKGTPEYARAADRELLERQDREKGLAYRPRRA